MTHLATCGRGLLATVFLGFGCESAVPAPQDGSTSAAGSSSSTSGPAVPEAASSSSTTTAGTSSTGSGSTTLDPDDSTTSSGADEGSTTTGTPPPTDAGCPACLVLIDELVGGRGIAVDESRVYVTDQTQGTIHQIMKDGGDGGILVDGQDAPYDIAVDDTHVYWTNFADAGAVMRVAKEGGDAEIIESSTRPRTIAVDDTHVYWGTFEIDDGNVYRRDVGLSSPPERLADMFGGISELTLAPDRVYWTAHAEQAGGGFIVDPTETPIGGIFSAPLDGTADPYDPTVHAASQAEPWGLARASEGQLVWANGDGSSENLSNRVVTLRDGPPEVLYAASAAPWGVAADGSFAYWTDNQRVWAIPLQGGEAIELAEQQNNARSIVADDEHVFWITRERVLQRPKP